MPVNFETVSGDELWKRVVAIFRNSLKEEKEISQMERHFPLFVSHELNGTEFQIGVTESIQVDWFTPMYAEKLEQALHLAGVPQNITVKFVVTTGNLPVYKPTAQSFQPAAQTETQRLRQPHGIPSTLPLHENYTFENFVRGPSNSFAHAAATAVAKGPGRTSYNPLFIYGGTGLGKTHLMEAIGHYVQDHSQGATVCFITAETFLNEYVNAMMNNALPAFRDRYRKVDVLLLDDVQFIAAKEKVQEEFFNTFNSLMLYQKQVVMTSDVAPRALQGIEERLISRFSGGMVVEIESPGYETRLAILKFKTQATNHLIPEDILKFIAENIRSHVRAIEGALRRVVTFMDLNADIPLTLEIAQHLLKDAIEEEKTIKDLSITDIMQTVATFYGVSINDIKSSERTQTLVTPRQMSMYLSRKLTTKSLPEIAKTFGKTHATVYHGTQTIQKRLDVEPELKKALSDIAAMFGRSLTDVME